MITEYLNSRLTRSFEQLETPSTVSRLLSTQHLEDEIYKKLTSKKFRKWALNDATVAHTRTAIHESISQAKPLQVVYPFGGYKLWQLASSPKVDWAEFFSISHYLDYLIPVANMYSPGVELKFSSDDFILERINNIASQDTDLYRESFIELVNLMQQYLPNNLTLELVRTSDLYSNDALEIELLSGAQAAKAYYRSLNSEQLNRDVEVAKKNIQWHGVRDLTALSENEKKEYILDSLIYHGAYAHLSKRLEYNRKSGKIILSASPSALAIPLGTTKKSVVKFWVGTGLIEEANDKITSMVISLQQLKGLKSEVKDTSGTIVSKGLLNGNFDHILTV